MASRMRTVARKVAAVKVQSMSTSPSNFYMNNLPDNQRSDNLQAQRNSQDDGANRIGPKHFHIIGIQELQHDQQDKRQSDKNGGGEPALSGAHFDFAIDA